MVTQITPPRFRISDPCYRLLRLPSIGVCWECSASKSVGSILSSGSKSRIAYHSFRPDTYYLAFPHDRLQAKLQVYAVLIFELFQSAVVAHDVVVALAVGGLGNFSAASELASDLYFSLDSLHTHWFSIPLAGGISECDLLSYEASLLIK